MPRQKLTTRRALATFIAVAAIGTLAVVLTTVAALTRTEMERSRSAARQAQARQLFIAVMAARGAQPQVPAELDAAEIHVEPAGETRFRVRVTIEDFKMTDTFRIGATGKPEPALHE